MLYSESGNNRAARRGIGNRSVLAVNRKGKRFKGFIVYSGFDDCAATVGHKKKIIVARVVISSEIIKQINGFNIRVGISREVCLIAGDNHTAVRKGYGNAYFKSDVGFVIFLLCGCFLIGKNIKSENGSVFNGSIGGSAVCERIILRIELINIRAADYFERNHACGARELFARSIFVKQRKNAPNLIFACFKNTEGVCFLINIKLDKPRSSLFF